MLRYQLANLSSLQAQCNNIRSGVLQYHNRNEERTANMQKTQHNRKTRCTNAKRIAQMQNALYTYAKLTTQTQNALHIRRTHNTYIRHFKEILI